MKCSDELRQDLARMIAEGEYSIPEICDRLGLSRRQIREWKRDDEEFRDVIKAAEDVRYQHRVHLAWQAQRKLLEGYQWQEVTEELEYIYPNDHIVGPLPEGTPETVITRVKSRKVVTKFRPPTASVVIHALRSLDPRFNDVKKIDHSSGGEPIKSLPNIFLNIPATAKSLKPADDN